jgi:hypothetical protein
VKSSIPKDVINDTCLSFSITLSVSAFEITQNQVQQIANRILRRDIAGVVMAIFQMNGSKHAVNEAQSGNMVPACFAGTGVILAPHHGAKPISAVTRLERHPFMHAQMATSARQGQIAYEASIWPGTRMSHTGRVLPVAADIH